MADKCSFRHCEAAIESEKECELWLESGECWDDDCKDRHSEQYTEQSFDDSYYPHVDEEEEDDEQDPIVITASDSDSDAGGEPLKPLDQMLSEHSARVRELTSDERLRKLTDTAAEESGDDEVVDEEALLRSPAAAPSADPDDGVFASALTDENTGKSVDDQPATDLSTHESITTDNASETICAPDMGPAVVESEDDCEEAPVKHCEASVPTHHLLRAEVDEALILDFGGENMSDLEDSAVESGALESHVVEPPPNASDTNVDLVADPPNDDASDAHVAESTAASTTPQRIKTHPLDLLTAASATPPPSNETAVIQGQVVSSPLPSGRGHPFPPQPQLPPPVGSPFPLPTPPRNFTIPPPPRFDAPLDFRMQVPPGMDPLHAVYNARLQLHPNLRLHGSIPIPVSHAPTSDASNTGSKWDADVAAFLKRSEQDKAAKEERARRLKKEDELAALRKEMDDLRRDAERDAMMRIKRSDKARRAGSPILQSGRKSRPAASEKQQSILMNVAARQALEVPSSANEQDADRKMDETRRAFVSGAKIRPDADGVLPSVRSTPSLRKSASERTLTVKMPSGRPGGEKPISPQKNTVAVSNNLPSKNVISLAKASSFSTSARSPAETIPPSVEVKDLEQIMREKALASMRAKEGKLVMERKAQALAAKQQSTNAEPEPVTPEKKLPITSRLTLSKADEMKMPDSIAASAKLREHNARARLSRSIIAASKVAERTRKKSANEEGNAASVGKADAVLKAIQNKAFKQNAAEKASIKAHRILLSRRASAKHQSSLPLSSKAREKAHAEASESQQIEDDNEEEPELSDDTDVEADDARDSEAAGDDQGEQEVVDDDGEVTSEEDEEQPLAAAPFADEQFAGSENVLQLDDVDAYDWGGTEAPPPPVVTDASTKPKRERKKSGLKVRKASTRKVISPVDNEEPLKSKKAALRQGKLKRKRSDKSAAASGRVVTVTGVERHPIITAGAEDLRIPTLSSAASAVPKQKRSLKRKAAEVAPETLANDCDVGRDASLDEEDELLAGDDEEYRQSAKQKKLLKAAARNALLDKKHHLETASPVPPEEWEHVAKDKKKKKKKKKSDLEEQKEVTRQLKEELKRLRKERRERKVAKRDEEKRKLAQRAVEQGDGVRSTTAGIKPTEEEEVHDSPNLSRSDDDDDDNLLPKRIRYDVSVPDELKPPKSILSRLGAKAPSRAEQRQPVRYADLDTPAPAPSVNINSTAKPSQPPLALQLRREKFGSNSAKTAVPDRPVYVPGHRMARQAAESTGSEEKASAMSAIKRKIPKSIFSAPSPLNGNSPSDSPVRKASAASRLTSSPLRGSGDASKSSAKRKIPGKRDVNPSPSEAEPVVIQPAFGKWGRTEIPFSRTSEEQKTAKLVHIPVKNIEDSQVKRDQLAASVVSSQPKPVKEPTPAAPQPSRNIGVRNYLEIGDNESALDDYLLNDEDDDEFGGSLKPPLGMNGSKKPSSSKVEQKQASTSRVAKIAMADDKLMDELDDLLGDGMEKPSTKKSSGPDTLDFDDLDALLA